jgi:hypothetical protein
MSGGRARFDVDAERARVDSVRHSMRSDAITAWVATTFAIGIIRVMTCRR